MNTIHIPDQWAILKIDKDLYKVFALWSKEERWRINSGITRVEEDEGFYYFYGYGGSCYKCSKNAYFNNLGYGTGVLSNMIETAKLINTEVIILPQETNWFELKL